MVMKNDLVNNTIDLENKAIGIIQENYLNSKETKVCLGFSGGKDSTVTLDLTLKAIMDLPISKRTKPIYVIYSCTGVELDPVDVVVNYHIERFEKFVEENNLPFYFKKVKPPLKHTYWSIVIAAGGMLFRSDKRDCTTKMKLIPQQKMMIETFTKKIVEESLFEDDIAVEKVVGKIKYLGIMGVRKEESDDRKKRIEKHSVQGAENLMDFDNRTTIIPISDWSTSDVWNYLYLRTLDWVDGYALSKIYAESSGQGSNECNTIVNGSEEAKKPGCSKSGRHGCWVCSLVLNEDKALQSLVQYYPYMKPLKEFRDWLVNTYTYADWKYRDLYNHKEHKRLMYRLDTNHRSGMVIPGGYTLEVRKLMLTKLLETEQAVQQYEGKENMQLISDEELNYIQERWFKEGDYRFTAKEIANRFNRNVSIKKDLEDMARTISYFAKTFKYSTSSFANDYAPDSRFRKDDLFNWIPIGLFSSKHYDRFVTQLAIQMKEVYKDKWISKYLLLLFPKKEKEYKVVLQVVKKLKISVMYFPSIREEECLRFEHSEDKVDYLNFVDQMERDMKADEEEFGLFNFEFSERTTPKGWFESKAKKFQELYKDFFEAYMYGIENQITDFLDNPLIPYKEKDKIISTWY